MPALSEVNGSVVSWDEESTAGTAPGGAYQIIRRLSDTLGSEYEQLSSALISSNPQIKSISRVGERVTGTIETELFCNVTEIAPLIEAGFRSGSGAFTDTDTDYSITGTNTLTRTADHEAALIAATAVGKPIRISGFTESVNNNAFLISAVTDAKNLLLTNLDGSAPGLTNEAVGDTVTVASHDIVCGTTKRSFTFEKYFPDLASGNKYIRFVNCRIAGVTFSVSTGQIVTVSLQVEGTVSSSQASTDSSGDIAAGTEDSLNAALNAGNLALAGTAVTDNFRTFSVSLNNNPESPQQIGSATPVDVVFGDQVVNGSLEAYFQSTAILGAVTANTDTSFSLSLTDAAGNIVYISAPSLYLRGFPSADGEVNVIPAEFDARQHPTQLTSLRVTFLPAP